MILYNVTITLEKDFAENWQFWMLEKHIPDVMATGKFLTFRMSKLLDHDHPDSEIFTIQYLSPNMEMLLEYHRDHAKTLQKEHSDKFSGKFVAFRTVMEVIKEG